MPDIIIINDNASFTSTSTSTTHSSPSTPHPHNRQPLRRKSTVQRLSHWVTKQISKPRLRADFPSSAENSRDNRSRETVATAGPGPHEEKDEEAAAVYESYAAFCDAFTASGHKEERGEMILHINAPGYRGGEIGETVYEPLEISPIDSGCYPSSSFSFERRRANNEKEGGVPVSLPSMWDADSRTDCTCVDSPGDVQDEGYDSHHTAAGAADPVPPPEVLTPALYAQMSRGATAAEQGKKPKRRWGCFRGSTIRSWFSRERIEKG